MVAVQRAIAALAGGGMVIVTDDEDREHEADLVLAAESVTAAQIAFVVRHSTGIVCAPMPATWADALDLPPMVQRNDDPHGTAFTVSVDHFEAGTGVSAANRALTLRALADACTRSVDLRRPGHIFPLRARDGGVLERAGHTEAAVDLLKLAGRVPVGVISELVGADGDMLRGPELAAFADTHGIPILSVGDIVQHRKDTLHYVDRVASTTLPTAFGEFEAVAYRSVLDGTEHLALVMGDVAAAGRSPDGVLVRVHSECLTGDILGSLRCDCGDQLTRALKAIANEGVGAVVYLRGHEGRGIGLADKIRAYALQERGYDTVDANLALGLPVDARDFEIGAAILADLGIARVRLITNNPHKQTGLRHDRVEIVARVQLDTDVNPHNSRYLRTKRERLGHSYQVELI